MRLHWIMLVVACLFLAAGCKHTRKENSAASNTEVSKPETNKEPAANTSKEPQPEPKDPEVDPESGEVCLLPPAAQKDDLGGLLKTGTTPPEIALTDTRTGKAVKLSDFKGKTVMIFFWASWCPTCKMACRKNGSLWKLMRTIDETTDSQVMILGVGTGSDDNADSQNAFLDSNECTWISTHDSGNKVEDEYGVLGVPTAVVIGKDGNVLTFGRYERKWRDDLLEYLKQECVTRESGS